MREITGYNYRFPFPLSAIKAYLCSPFWYVRHPGVEHAGIRVSDVLTSGCWMY